MSFTSDSNFKQEFDKVFGTLVKEAGGPPPLPDEVYELNPWEGEEGENKPVAQMTKQELANLVLNLDDTTFNELKSVLDKVEMPGGDVITSAPNLADDIVSFAMEGSSSKETLEDALRQMELGEGMSPMEEWKQEDDESAHFDRESEEREIRYQTKGKEDAEKLEEWMAQVESPVLWVDGNRPGSIYLSSGSEDKEYRAEYGGAPHEISLSQALHLLREQPYAEENLYFNVENLANPEALADDRHTRPTVEMPMDADPQRHTRPTIMTLAPEEKREFMASSEFAAAFEEWMGKRGEPEFEPSPTFEEAYGEYEKTAEVRLSKRQ